MLVVLAPICKQEFISNNGEMVPEAIAGWKDDIQYLKVLRISCALLICAEDEQDSQYLKGDANRAHKGDEEDAGNEEVGKQGYYNKPEPLDLSITRVGLARRPHKGKKGT